MSQDRSGAGFDCEARDRLVDRMAQLVEEKYAVPSTARRAAAGLRKCSADGRYHECASEAEFAEAITRDLQELTADAHLRLVFDPGRVSRLRHAQGKAPGGFVRDLAKACSFGFARVENLKGNVGLIDIRHFFPPAIAAEAGSAAMRLVAEADAVVIDLRSNTGGDPSMVQFLCSYFFDGEPAIHLNTITSRAGKLEYWTLPDVPGMRIPAAPLFILTSAHTFSGGEEFAYNMQSLGRGTIVGETTAGGANPASMDVMSDCFYATVPHATPTNPITQSNWQGSGVEPHIRIDADRALETAHMMALRHLTERGDDPEKLTKLEWWLEEVESSYRPVEISRETLGRYVGSFDGCEVSLGAEGLMYHRRFFQYRLVPLDSQTFWLDGPRAGFESRIRFVLDETGTAAEIVGLFPDGRRVTRRRDDTG